MGLYCFPIVLFGIDYDNLKLKDKTIGEIIEQFNLKLPDTAYDKFEYTDRLTVIGSDLFSILVEYKEIDYCSDGEYKHYLGISPVYTWRLQIPDDILFHSEDEAANYIAEILLPFCDMTKKEIIGKIKYIATYACI